MRPLDSEQFRLRLKSAMSQAIRESGMDRNRIAAEVAILTDRPMSRSALDALTSPSKLNDISVVRLKALARVLSAPKLYEAILADEGLSVLQTDDRLRADMQALQTQRSRIDSWLAQLEVQLAGKAGK
ncbi:hypothetical protein DYI37_11545 [Fulvimarina endophytica]|uniref:Uncharacterized protein n=1 Tax=Fulvimarina endophytica TaxID=2293836 RepID=A0A371X323_9HYPH|nr:hypothetical protein [Fulvimarina endophytica]RFC63631.1 hypothetical protein DYI37_11545 [Fulvimarina endophytica]